MFAGIAVDGPNKTSSDISGNAICMIKKKGKVKALDEELYSRSMHIWFLSPIMNCSVYEASAVYVYYTHSDLESPKKYVC